MRLDKIFMSSAYACVAVALITIAVTKGRDKDSVDVKQNDCIDVATRLGDDCRYWSDTFDAPRALGRCSHSFSLKTLTIPNFQAFLIASVGKMPPFTSS